MRTRWCMLITVYIHFANSNFFLYITLFIYLFFYMVKIYRNYFALTSLYVYIAEIFIVCCVKRVRCTQFAPPYTHIPTHAHKYKCIGTYTHARWSPRDYVIRPAYAWALPAAQPMILSTYCSSSRLWAFFCSEPPK